MPISTNIKIIPATIKDIHVIQKLAYQIWPPTYSQILTKEQIEYMLDFLYSLKALEEQMENLRHKFIIACDLTQPVAFASYSFPFEPSVCKLHKLYALPEQQGKGLGRLLIDHIIYEIKLLGAIALQLNVNRQNKAKNFYEHLGFSIIGEENIDIGNGYFMTDYIMELLLV
jgi:GNAT superfamily N-acetyltransferase